MLRKTLGQFSACFFLDSTEIHEKNPEKAFFQIFLAKKPNEKPSTTRTQPNCESFWSDVVGYT